MAFLKRIEGFIRVAHVARYRCDVWTNVSAILKARRSPAVQTCEVDIGTRSHGEAKSTSGVGDAVLNNIGLAKLSGVHRRGGLRFFLKARTLYQAAGDSKGEATTLINIATVHSLSAKPTEALVALNQALRVSVEHGDSELEARASSIIGAVYVLLGQRKVAQEFYERAIALYREVNNEEGAIRAREAMTAF